MTETSITKTKHFSKIEQMLGVLDFVVKLKRWYFSEPNQKKPKIITENKSNWVISEFYFQLKTKKKNMETHRTLSYGQKRLFSFIYYAACNPYIIIADEMVNGIHQQWIDECMDLITDRQCFLTSQNPLLLDYLEFESAEDVHKTFIQCKRLEGENEDVQMVWSNLKPEDAQTFYGAYQRGFQHVSEILIIHGFW